MFANGSSSPWVITEAEQQQNDVQFATLNPVNGLVSGDRAKPLFMKSALPPAVLAQVWQLADYNKDGKVDRYEFSVAMHLIRTVMAGIPLPPSLPDSMKPPALAAQTSLDGLSNNTGVMKMSGSSTPVMGIPGMTSAGIRSAMGAAAGMPVAMPAGTVGTPPSIQTAPPMSTAVPLAPGVGRVQGDWTIAHHNKLKYCQQFNQLDKGRVGTLSGVHARNVLAQSQLPNVTLAEIWNLSDVNKDGRLSVEEFCIAMHLIDSVKAGFLLPKKLPPELLSMCVRSKSESPVLDVNASPAQKAPPPRTFEDKRRDNYDRGQAELDRRRQILREEEERRRAEQEKKEREEAERKEREREEAEKRRRAERQAELEREREREAARQAEERRILAEKEEARREMERQRKADLDAIRIRDVKAQRQAEIDNTAQRQQRKKTLSFQLQALDEKSAELNATITKARDRIVQITSHIEAMKSQRDDKIAIIRNNEANNHNTSVQCERLAHESLQLQAECQGFIGRAQKIEEVQASLDGLYKGNSSIQEQLQSVDKRTQLQKQLVSEKANELERYRARLAQLMAANASLREQLVSAQQRVTVKIQQMHMQQQAQQAEASAAQQLAIRTEPSDSKMEHKESDAYEDHEEPQVSTASAVGASLPQATSTTTGAVKYRALYEFNARTEDELSFQPGDIILVFEGHAAEPGWLAGQMRDKVGWFPLAFAEPIATVGAAITQPPQTVSAVICSPSSEPLQSITEEPPLLASKSTEFEHAVSDRPNNVSIAKTPAKESGAEQETVLGVAIAQYQWKARNESELNFSKGERIEILEQLEMRWKGRSRNGAVGWFPKSYVKMCEDSSQAEPEASTTAPISAQESLTKSPQTTPGETPSSPSAGAPSTAPICDTVSGEPSETIGSGSGAAGEWYIALYDFKASEPTDLELSAGDRILVTEASDDWWRGTCGGRSGIFPANYVQKCPKTEAVTAPEGGILGIGRVLASFETTAENQLSLHVGETVTVRSKSPAGWWQGEIVSSGGVKRVGWFPGNYVEMVQQESEVIAEALYDYVAQRSDELSFKNGDLIVVTERSDAEWWKGRLQKTANGPEALFPANYVHVSAVACSRMQPTPREALTSGQAEGMSAKLDTATEDTVSRQSTRDTISQTSNANLTKLTEELLETEVRFHRDLCMCREEFVDTITPVIGTSLAKRLFLNLDQLIAVSAEIANALRVDPPGKVFVQKAAALHAFVEFCSNQQSARELLKELELNNPAFQQVYRRCCENARAGGLDLRYLILLPVGRITRYPLLFEKLIKYTPKESSTREDLERAYQMLKSLCAEVNTVICEQDNANMLLWAQQHIHCEGITPAIVFSSRTRKVGPRLFLHAGILQKQRSGKILVALLFNDFLMFTTPIEPIEVDGFKITKNSDMQLNLYKSPLLLADLSVQAKEKEGDECALTLKYGTIIIPMRAMGRNARVLWASQLGKAIEGYRQQATLQKASTALSLDSSARGRLLVELVCVRNLSVESSASDAHLVVCQFQLGSETATSEVDLSQGDNLFTTQLPILTDHPPPFRVLIFLPRLYSPDVCAGVGEVAMNELVTAAAAHRGPISRQIYLTAGSVPSSQGFAIVKFVVQMFH
uniref:Intersectin-1 n=1 Tax=Ascaris suum TaxID=6253 RepID=F1KQL1_ASCSU